METKISETDFKKIIDKYVDDNKLFSELNINKTIVEKDIYNACKFDLTKFGKHFPSGAYYYMNILS